jgi:hypothetical protein
VRIRSGSIGIRLPLVSAVGFQNLLKHIRYFDRLLVLSSINSKKNGLSETGFQGGKGVIMERAPKLPKWTEKIAVDLAAKVERKEARNENQPIKGN